MNWDSFNDYGLGFRDAFETLNNQLFERYIRRTETTNLEHFRAVNGSGGDGGVEAYAKLKNGDIYAVQSKWFRNSLADNELGQIKKSITTAKTVRPQIKKYFICVPHDVNSSKIGKGKKLTTGDEESRINDLIDEIAVSHPDLELIWWFDNELLTELQQSDNEGVRKYWFEKSILTSKYPKDQFELEKKKPMA